MSIVLEDVLEKFDTYEAYWEEAYNRGEDDANFTLGINQWSEKMKAQRKDGNVQRIDFTFYDGSPELNALIMEIQRDICRSM